MPKLWVRVFQRMIGFCVGDHTELTDSGVSQIWLYVCQSPGGSVIKTEMFRMGP